MKSNIIVEKSKTLALQIISLYKDLSTNKQERILSKQLLRSGTSIGANIREAQNSVSKASFHAKMNIALAESNETLYWLELLQESNIITEREFLPIYTEAQEINNILIAIVKSSTE